MSEAKHDIKRMIYSEVIPILEIAAEDEEDLIVAQETLNHLIFLIQEFLNHERMKEVEV